MAPLCGLLVLVKQLPRRDHLGVLGDFGEGVESARGVLPHLAEPVHRRSAQRPIGVPRGAPGIADVLREAGQFANRLRDIFELCGRQTDAQGLCVLGPGRHGVYVSELPPLCIMLGVAKGARRESEVEPDEPCSCDRAPSFARSLKREADDPSRGGADQCADSRPAGRNPRNCFCAHAGHAATVLCGPEGFVSTRCQRT